MVFASGTPKDCLETREGVGNGSESNQKAGKHLLVEVVGTQPFKHVMKRLKDYRLQTVSIYFRVNALPI